MPHTRQCLCYGELDSLQGTEGGRSFSFIYIYSTNLPPPSHPHPSMHTHGEFSIGSIPTFLPSKTSFSLLCLFHLPQSYISLLLQEPGASQTMRACVYKKKVRPNTMGNISLVSWFIVYFSLKQRFPNDQILSRICSLRLCAREREREKLARGI